MSKILDELNKNYDGSTGTWGVVQEWTNDRGEMGVYVNSHSAAKFITVIYVGEKRSINILDSHLLSETMLSMRTIAEFAGAKPRL